MSDTAPRRILVYDVGGSHVAAAICSEHSNTLCGVSHAPLPEPNPNPFSAASFGRLIHTLGESAISAAGLEPGSITGASLAFPGPFDYEAGVSRMTHKLPTLLGIDLKSALAARFNWPPARVLFRNNADCFLLGELAAGAAQTFSRAVGLTLGTGIGSAFAIHNGTACQIVTRGSGVPADGEIWNLPYNGGIVEDYVSSRFLRQFYERQSGLSTEVVSIAHAASHPGDCPPGSAPAPAKTVDLDGLELPHCRARQAFAEFGRHLGHTLNLAFHINGGDFAPEVVVLGGGIARAAQLFLPETRKVLATHPPVPVLAISKLMDRAALVGAGVHWFSRQTGR